VKEGKSVGNVRSMALLPQCLGHQFPLKKQCSCWLANAAPKMGKDLLGTGPRRVCGSRRE
jgi:hypothetical protein